MKIAISLLTLLVALAATTTAQTADKKSLTLKGAEAVIAAAKSEAQKLNAPGGVIAVVDDGGNLMALERLDGTFSAGANISIGKARTAVMFKKPTRFFEELINSSGKGRTVMTALENFTPLIGGIPILVEGQIVGGVGVSGAATADQDEQVAIAGSKAFERILRRTRWTQLLRRAQSCSMAAMAATTWSTLADAKRQVRRRFTPKTPT
jgi:glc operon protein GlcG